MVISYTTLDHKGGFYMYRIHNPKVSMLCTDGFEPLKSYLYTVFNSRPDHYFNNGGPRSSSLKFKLPTDLLEVRGHEVSNLAKYGLNENEARYKANHTKVQMFMLENDSSTLAIEVPIWLEPYELEQYKEIFDSEEPLSGHIDVLRVEDGKIWVWDYKPNACKEKYAATQTYFYALMLSRRTGIPLANFRCGYFDDKNTYVFKPHESFLTTVDLFKF